MGGKIFANELPTPRMSPVVYGHLRLKYISILSTLYERVDSSADAPEKSSYGDIDILVSSPRDSAHPPTSAILTTALCAVKSIDSEETDVKYFAVPYPDEPGIFVQVDVQICTTPALFDWKLFHSSYGDMWNILGTAIRIFGLTANNRGLHVHIHDPEAVTQHHVEQNKFLLFLTCEPDAVLRFVGLSVAEYRAGWTRLEDMFAFLARNRFMTKEAYMPRELKASDRRRIRDRDIYRRFIEDWVPGWSDGGGGCGGGKWEEIRKARQTAVLHEALDQFGKRAEYDAMLVDWTVKRKESLDVAEARKYRKMLAVQEAESAVASKDYLESSSSINQ